MKKIIILLFCLLNLSCSKDSEPTLKDLEVIIPEDAGYSSQKLEQAKQFASQSGYDAVMALYDGKVLFTWGQVDKNYKCHSIWKPFLSALYGIHVAWGNINLDATLEKLGIDDIPPVLTATEKQATVRDLLKSRSGVYHPAAAETQEMKDNRPARGSHEHNTFFYYNNWDFNVGGVIFEQETKTKIFEEFKKLIADPIGMQDFNLESCYLGYEYFLSNHPSWRFRMSARDLARFGALYQKHGVWNGKRLISQEWIIESTTAYSILDENTGIGYGYRWYIIPKGSPFAQIIGSKGFFHTGLGVQIVLVVEDLNLVIVELLDTDGNWTDPGEAGMQLGMLIINSKLQ